MVSTVRPHGVQMARDLDRLIQKNDNAHYDVISTSGAEAQTMGSWAQRLITGTNAAIAS